MMQQSTQSSTIDEITSTTDYVTATANYVTSTAGYVAVVSDKVVKKLEITSTMNDNSNEQYNFIMSGIAVPILCLPGLVGNALAVIVWTRPGLATSTGRYLTAQAVADFFVLLFYFLNDCLQAWEPPVVFGVPYAYYFSYVGFPGYSLAVILHVWCTVGVTIDLCVMVCWVLKAKIYCNTRVANIFITSLTITGFLINIPYFFTYRPFAPATPMHTTTDNNNTNDASADSGSMATPNGSEKNRIYYTPTAFGKGRDGLYYGFFVHCVLLIVIPWTSIFIMNLNVISQLVRSNRRMADKKSAQSVKNSKQTEFQITRLQLGVTISFIVLIGINCVVHCTWMLMPPQIDKELITSCFMFAKTGVFFNAACHYIFYCILSKRFRTELGKILCLTSFRNRKPETLQVANS